MKELLLERIVCFCMLVFIHIIFPLQEIDSIANLWFLTSVGIIIDTNLSLPSRCMNGDLKISR